MDMVHGRRAAHKSKARMAVDAGSKARMAVDAGCFVIWGGKKSSPN